MNQLSARKAAEYISKLINAARDPVEMFNVVESIYIAGQKSSEEYEATEHVRVSEKKIPPEKTSPRFREDNAVEIPNVTDNYIHYQLGDIGAVTLIKAFGETKTLKAWSEDDRCTITPQSLRFRLRRGIDPEAAISKPPKNRGRKKRDA